MFVSLVHQLLFDNDTDKLAKTDVDPYIFISSRKRIVGCSNRYVFNKINLIPGTENESDTPLCLSYSLSQSLSISLSLSENEISCSILAII